MSIRKKYKDKSHKHHQSWRSKQKGKTRDQHEEKLWEQASFNLKTLYWIIITMKSSARPTQIPYKYE